MSQFCKLNSNTCLHLNSAFILYNNSEFNPFNTPMFCINLFEGPFQLKDSNVLQKYLKWNAKKADASENFYFINLRSASKQIVEIFCSVLNFQFRIMKLSATCLVNFVNFKVKNKVVNLRNQIKERYIRYSIKTVIPIM